jgi:hypothetical protein
VLTISPPFVYYLSHFEAIPKLPLDVPNDRISSILVVFDGSVCLVLVSPHKKSKRERVLCVCVCACVCVKFAPSEHRRGLFHRLPSLIIRSFHRGKKEIGIVACV